MATIAIIKDTDRKFYTTSRPIICQIVDDEGDAAYMVGEIERETYINSGQFVGTGVYINAYEDNDNPNFYSFNLMGYIRELVIRGQFSWLPIGVLPGFYELGGFFRLRIHAKRYASSPNQPFVEDINDNVISRAFYALDVHTDYTQRLEAQGAGYNHHNIDRLVLGNNTSYYFDDISLKYSQNSPDYNKYGQNSLISFRSHIASKSYTINRKDSKTDAIYQPVGLSAKQFEEFWLTIYIFDSTGDNIAGVTTMYIDDKTDLYKIPAHPDSLVDFITVNGGTNTNLIIDGSDNLISRGVIVLPFVKGTLPGYRYLYHSKNPAGGFGYQIDTLYIDWLDKPGNGECDRTKFIFKNSQGGYDWINIYGTETKEVKNNRTIYDRFANSTEGSLHNRTVLHTDREDIFNLVSQPVGKEIALHMEELLSSTMVWIDQEIKHPPYKNNWNQETNMLIPVVINTDGSLIYTTESGTSYIEISYSYSEQLTMQTS